MLLRQCCKVFGAAGFRIMVRKIKYWLVVVAVLATAAIAWLSYTARLEHRRRETYYQETLKIYTAIYKPGMSRSVIEDDLHAHNIPFRQMCCADINDFRKHIYDDLVKIGQEDAPFVCREENIYVAFQFVGSKPPDGISGTNPSDTLKIITIYPWLEGCL